MPTRLSSVSIYPDKLSIPSATWLDVPSEPAQAKNSYSKAIEHLPILPDEGLEDTNTELIWIKDPISLEDHFPYETRIFFDLFDQWTKFAY